MNEAHFLAYATQGDHFLAVGAVKRPRENYKSDVARKSEHDITDYAAELGWIYVTPEARGIGLGSRISKALCDSYEGAMFATTRTDNQDMHGIVKKLGFRAVGKPYESAEHVGKKIQLWVLPRRANAP
jgi:GNAT superfamily N-acetyltransferase